jgi:hypothetical protein
MSNDSNHSQAVIAEAEGIFGRIAAWQLRLLPRWRRITRALHGLGILDITGSDWVKLTRRGIAFRPLTPEQADRLARHLEDLENGVRVEPAKPGPGQYPLDFLPAPSPNSIPVESTYHAGAAR